MEEFEKKMEKKMKTVVLSKFHSTRGTTLQFSPAFLPTRISTRGNPNYHHSHAPASTSSYSQTPKAQRIRTVTPSWPNSNARGSLRRGRGENKLDFERMPGFYLGNGEDMHLSFLEFYPRHDVFWGGYDRIWAQAPGPMSSPVQRDSAPTFDPILGTPAHATSAHARVPDLLQSEEQKR